MTMTMTNTFKERFQRAIFATFDWTWSDEKKCPDQQKDNDRN